MTKLLYFLTPIIFISCGNSNTGKTTATNINDSVTITKADTLSSTIGISVVAKNIDSIDKANSYRINSEDENNIQKADISRRDSSIWIGSNMRYDHRIFGYEKPDTASKKMILISIFTNDVERNPFNCPYGSYYKTDEMANENLRLKYVSQQGKFISAKVLMNDSIQGIVFIEKRWVEFDQ